VYARTGKGFLKPTGVEEIRAAKEKITAERPITVKGDE
jgi:hypothetical protein